LLVPLFAGDAFFVVEVDEEVERVRRGLAGIASVASVASAAFDGSCSMVLESF
jgi:hypothetical protein